MPPRKPLTAAQLRERERKLVARKERNRASAAAHRERKNSTIERLTAEVNQLKEENVSLQALAEENRQLRTALAAAAAAAGSSSPSGVEVAPPPASLPAQPVFRVPFIPKNHAVCQNTKPLPAVYAF
jgi:hypothetical protein